MQRSAQVLRCDRPRPLVYLAAMTTSSRFGPRTLRRRWIVVAAFVLFATSCGGSDAADSATADEPDPTAVAATPEPEPEPTEAPADPEPTAEPEPEPTETAADEAPADDPPEDESPVEFYDAPGALEVPQPLPPGEPGMIIDTEPLNLDSGEGLRILYHST